MLTVFIDTVGYLKAIFLKDVFTFSEFLSSGDQYNMITCLRYLTGGEDLEDSNPFQNGFISPPIG